MGAPRINPLDFLATMNKNDVSIAQTDLRHLSLTQLLHLRCHDDVCAALVTKPSSPFVATFIAAIHTTLESKLAEKFSDDLALSPPATASELMRNVVLVFGAHAILEHSPSKWEIKRNQTWMVRVGSLKFLVNLMSGKVRDLGDSPPPCLCYRSMSRASAAVPKHKLKLHWEVELSKPFEFADAVFIPRNQLRRSMRASKVFSTGSLSKGSFSTGSFAEDGGASDGEVAT